MEAKPTARTEKLARELATQAGTIDELNGLLAGLMKSSLGRMPDAEMDAHLKGEEPPLPFDRTSCLTDRSRVGGAGVRWSRGRAYP